VVGVEAAADMRSRRFLDVSDEAAAVADGWRAKEKAEVARASMSHTLVDNTKRRMVMRDRIVDDLELFSAVAWTGAVFLMEGATYYLNGTNT
jgi:hypothetical protein